MDLQLVFFQFLKGFQRRWPHTDDVFGDSYMRRAHGLKCEIVGFVGN